MFRTDICIAGAGIIGLSLAFELHAHGLDVIVLESGSPMQQASTAAAGMLAAEDPHNPAELRALSNLSISLYPSYLRRLEEFGGVPVPFQTTQTLQSFETDPEFKDAALPSDLFTAAGFRMLQEHSLDPRQLASSLLAAVRATSIHLLSNSPVNSATTTGNLITITTPTHTVETTHFVDCTGAWVGTSTSDPAFEVIPIKGQMLVIALPKSLSLDLTVRTKDIYIVPRTTGPNAGRAIIGATVEDVGFDKTVHPLQIAALHHRAARLLPQLIDADVVESWSGLRPATSDRLPILGAHPTKPNHWVATGHYRNGILLAPATAHVMTQLIRGRSPSISLEAFNPSRSSLRRASEL